ncbi:hypothetical protein ZIOFF_062957 [Zingiber officinale]|uniref:DNA helicase n=1 Tax=Zingiber officinale TaxID=94328 RepID=A0A8J5F5K3_ZINOF|nr:hypothetical protein ZIOFF_062957 [Zingiber officinale]
MLDICQKEGLILSPTKMKIAQPEIEFLGVIIGNRKIKLQQHIIKKIIDINEETLTTLKGLRSFLGILNYAQSYIPNLSKLLGPLYSKTSPHGDRRFKSSDWAIIKEVKTLVQKLPDVELPPSDAYIIIETDGWVEIKFEHIEGVNNELADALSRLVHHITTKGCLPEKQIKLIRQVDSSMDETKDAPVTIKSILGKTILALLPPTPPFLGTAFLNTLAFGLNMLQLGKLFQMVDALATPIEKERLLEKYKNHELNSVCVEDWSELTKKLLRALPYSLTPSQQNAVSEIIWDLKRPVPMNRLLQGDVGCGKTVVAFLACMEVISSGFQGLHTGEISMVIGTHSLIAEKVKFYALRLTVIDEQHRFGVIQRGKFNSKLYSAFRRIKLNWRNLDDTVEEKDYMAPHVLAMSATPIPRTLALALYGDMSLTQITDMPPGRVPVQTFAFEGNKIGFEKLFQMMRDELTGSGKVYLVYPVITGSEQLPMLRAATAEFESISQRFKGYQCGLLHGRMTGDQKADALRQFRSGETRILLATQVIEIGVDIPDASLMVVMNAEKFGIAQLHQLRGRVGRGERKSKCIFLSSTSGALNRLKVLERSSDGFYLANADLLLRGPGNLLGKKQSGHIPEFPIARLEIDGNILQEAQLAALNVLGASNDLQLFPKLLTELSMRQPLCILGD